MKTVVVGAGGGGIASALLASLRNEDVTLVEGHENLGGCASWFHRGAFCFDVGATTLSGVATHEPMGKLFALLGDSPELKPVDPGIVFHLSSGKKLHYFKDFDKWLGELEREFPDLNHRPFWKKIYSINHEAWGLLANLPSFPFKKISHFWQGIRSPRHYHLFPYLFVSTEMMVKFYHLNHPEYLELLNGILLISAQAEAREIPFLVGAMALAYPRETYAPVGGMKGLMDFLERKCLEKNVKILKKSPVVHLVSNKVTLKEGKELEADRVILNVPYWNIPGLFLGPEKKLLQHEFKEKKVAWGAFTLYLGIKTQCHELYQQIHLNHPKVKNYFVSFSIPEDLSRAPEGWQSVTISTHVDVGEWIESDSKTYQANKLELMNLILKDFLDRFGIYETKFVTAGTPKTFERYTGRKSGYVGGLPFLYGMNPWKIQGHGTDLKEVYRVGDTTFPGQGLVGVVAGALALDATLKKEPSR